MPHLIEAKPRIKIQTYISMTDNRYFFSRKVRKEKTQNPQSYYRMVSTHHNIGYPTSYFEQKRKNFTLFVTNLIMTRLIYKRSQNMYKFNLKETVI